MHPRPRLLLFWLMLLSACVPTPEVRQIYVTATPAITSTPAPSPTATPWRKLVKVTQVLDGRTIQVSLNGQIARVRYIGIECPEIRSEHGPAALRANGDLVMGEKVWLVSDSLDADEEGRLLRYVYLADNRFVNEELLRQGYCQLSLDPPNTQHYQEFLAVYREARRSGSNPYPRSASASPTRRPPTPRLTRPPQPAAVCSCSGNTLNCGDFGTQVAAQACHNYCVSIGRGDIHGLDGDHDGIACESLP